MLKKGIICLLPLLLLINFININNSFAYKNVKSVKSDSSSKTLLDFTKERITRNFEDIITEHEIIKILNEKGIKKYLG